MISKKLAAAVGAGAVAGAVGISVAGGAFTASAAPATAGSTTATHAKGAHAKGAHAGKRHGRFGELSRVLHGEGVVKTKTGYETVDVDRGTVTAVTPTSVTITSADKVAETFTAVSGSKIRLDGKTVPLSSAKVGDKAGALAVKSGAASNIKILILRDSAAKAHTKAGAAKTGAQTSGATA